MIATDPLVTQKPATLDDLMQVNEKAELIGGRIVRMMATGFLPGRIARRILLALSQHASKVSNGEAFGDNVGYAVSMLRSGRESFSPDVSFYSGPQPANPMGFIPGAPAFAVEIRSECDYRSGAGADMAAKRADYFEAGTLVVWDVDTQAKRIDCYRKSAMYVKESFSIGQIANAEPAVPGWTVLVDEIFRA